ncbi:uncharacterized protein [Ptychodera flava]|uniref:uncharacterized protein n=1 Tax=Ptychodera flava TaxID=63121 RepID=UPI00396A9E2F
MSAAGHAPCEYVKQVELIHAEDEDDIDRQVRPIAQSIEKYCKLTSKAEFATHFTSDEAACKDVVQRFQKVKASTTDKQNGPVHAVVMVSKKFLRVICKDSETKKAVEACLLGDANGKSFAVIWTDVTEKDIGAFSQELSKRWEDRAHFPVIQTAHYRQYDRDFAALAEGVYKVWNGSGTYVERPNQPLSLREASKTETITRREPVESLDPTAVTEPGYSSSPTVCADGNEGLFMLQDKMASQEDNNTAAVSPDTGNSRVKQGSSHDKEPKLAVGNDGCQSLFDREDRQSSDSNNQGQNLAIDNGAGVQVPESGEGNSEKVIGADPNPCLDLCHKDEDSLPAQSDGCSDIQSAQQNSIQAPVNQDDRPTQATPDARESDSIESDQQDSNQDQSNKSTEDSKSHQDRCSDPDCPSGSDVVPENQFYTSKEPLIKDLDQDQREELMILLDPPAACVKDWRHLASRKGVPNKKITYWEKKTDSGTISYLKFLEAKYPNYTVKQFKADVKAIQRMDVLDLLQNFDFKRN